MGRIKYLSEILILTLILVLLLAKLSFGLERDYTSAVIHHTSRETDKNQDPSAEEINRWHKERGWNGIGYHVVIRKNGKIEYGRDYHKQGAHAKGRNHFTGIALCGSSSFTNAQIVSLKKILNKFNINNIYRHHEKCPGGGINIEQIQKELKK